MKKLDKIFWDQKYKDARTGWDIGYPSPPIIEFMNGISDKSKEILIPGAGNGYEALYLSDKGFKKITVIDISSIAANRLRTAIGGRKGIEVIEGDFFDHHGKYNFIIEQTFFCALLPAWRPKYVKHMHSLLADGGYLTGVLFATVFSKEGPPYGGTISEYKELFSSQFIIEKMELCYNSIPQRMGNEYFVKMKKKP